jgi:putative ABC transport system permease protein
MSWIHRLTNLFRHRQVNSEADEELRFHVDSRTRDNLGAGMTDAEARRDAMRRLGGTLQSRERTADADLFVWLDTLGRDTRIAFRNLSRNLAVTSVAALSLALGIGANTAIFSAIHAVLLRPLPYHDPGRLANLWMDNRRQGFHEDLSAYGNFVDWKNNRVFVDMAGYYPSDTVLSGFEEPVRVRSGAVDANLFSVLGVAPLLGRTFNTDEMQQGGSRAVILSYGLWQRLLGADRSLVGRKIELDGKPSQVVGIMPAGFAFPFKDTQLWEPLALTPAQRANRGGYFLSVIGRLKPGIALPQARTEMTAIGARLEAQYPGTNRGYGIWVVPLLDQMVGMMRQGLLVLWGAAGFVLLIACANVANLLLGRGASRTREISVRAALGAGRGRLVRQLLTESAVLAVVAGGLGLAIAFWGIRLLVLAAPKDLPRLDEISVDPLVLAFTLGIALLSGLLVGILPAVRVSGVNLQQSLREGGRSMAGASRSRWMRASLTVTEVAFSMILLTGAGLMIRSLVSLEATHPGFRTDNVLTWRVSASRTKFAKPTQLAPFFSDLLRGVQAIPGVKGAAAVTDIFLSITPNSGNFTVEGQPPLPPEEQVEATVDTVTPNYFQVMGTPLIAGRFFNEQDGDTSVPVVIVNQTMARRFWPNRSAVGQRFKMGGPASTNPWKTIAGVVADQRRQGLEKPARCETFSPQAQRPARGMYLVVHTASDPALVAGSVRAAVRAIDPSAVMFERSTIAEQIGDSLSTRRFETLLLALFAAVALALAAAGIYGVVYQSVSQRTNELGIRAALGAQRVGLLRMIVGEALRLVLIGAVLGGLGELAVARLLRGFLYSVGAADPITYGAVCLLLGGIAALASAIPARRAVAVDPIHSLRYE